MHGIILIFHVVSSIVFCNIRIIRKTAGTLKVYYYSYWTNLLRSMLSCEIEKLRDKSYSIICFPMNFSCCFFLIKRIQNFCAAAKTIRTHFMEQFVFTMDYLLFSFEKLALQRQESVFLAFDKNYGKFVLFTQAAKQSSNFQPR